MDKHAHEWEWAEWLGGPSKDIRVEGVRCKHCKYELEDVEVEARLNATERLSAEDASKMADEMEAEKRTSTTRHIRELRAYVSILEERNG